jgi:hypothetical protein
MSQCVFFRWSSSREGHAIRVLELRFVQKKEKGDGEGGWEKEGEGGR